MKLRSVSIRRMPGITRPFRLEAADLGPGLNLVVGPNAVGKSSLCRAVRALLWPEAEPDLELDAEASWEIDGQVLTVCAVPGRPRRWSAGDEAVAAIELPPAHLAGCYSISLLEVIRFEAEGVTDEHLQKELRRQLAGGYDLDEVERLFQGKPKAGRSEVRALSDAERAVRELARRREALAQREARLEEVRRERDAARRAARRAEVLGRALEVARKRRQLGALRADAERRFPEGIERLAGDEKERLDRLRAERAEVEQKIAQARAMIAQAAQDAAVWGMEDDPPTPAALEALRIRAQEVLRARDAWLEAEQAAEVGRRALEQARRALGNDFDPAAAGGVDEVFLETLDRLGVQREQVRARLARAEQAAGQTTVGPAWLPWLVAAVALALGLASLGLDWARPAGRLLPMAGAGLTALAVWLLLAHRQRCRAAATLAEVQEEWEAACRHWRALEEQVGIDLPEGDLHSGSLVGKLRRWQQADADQQRLEAGVQVSSRRHQTLLEEIAGALARWKVEAVPDAAAAQAAVADLATRAESHRRAQDRRQEAECRVADLEQRLERLNSAEAELFARAGVKAGDDPGAADRALVERLALRDDYLAMVNSRNELEWQIDQAERELGEDIALAERDPAELEEEIEALEFEAGRFDALQQQVADTEAEVQQARRSHDMARALEAREQARRDLERALEGQLLRAAGRVLMRRVRERHAREAAPKVLARAARLLAHFTRQGYELRADPSSGRLQVRDGGSGEVLGLRALSDGTRAQVRLAARLAFAFEAEGRHQLPVWLDEALTAADPERFAAVADSLIEVMLREDRQVFYLSANPSDVEAWQQALERRGESRANVIDLGRLRRGQATAGPPWVPPPPITIPDPAASDPSAFAAAVGVARIDPWAEVDGLHLFYLLADDLPLLAQLLAAGIETVGQWTIYRRQRAATAWVGVEQAARVDAAVAVATEFFRAFRRGRPRAVRREDLLAGGVVSEKFFESVAALSEKLGGDGSDLIAALRERVIKGFHRATADKLEQDLRQRGLIDEDPALDFDEICARTLSAARRYLDAGCLDAPRIRAIVATLWGQVTRESGG